MFDGFFNRVKVQQSVPSIIAQDILKKSCQLQVRKESKMSHLKSNARHSVVSLVGNDQTRILSHQENMIRGIEKDIGPQIVNRRKNKAILEKKKLNYEEFKL
jgi:hypothetical protein